MKIKHVKKQVLASATCEVFREKVLGQWIGNGYSTWRADNLPELNEQMVQALFDMTQAEAGKKYNYEEVYLPAWNMTDVDDGEKLLSPLSLTLGQMTVCRTGNRDVPYVLINEEALKPVEKMEYDLFLRERADGELYVAVKCGCSLVGIVSEVRRLTDVEGRELRRIGDAVNAMYMKKGGEEDEEGV